jgi:hypothetical protein
MKENLRAPSYSQVTRWGTQLKLSLQQIRQVNESLHLRHQLG